MKKAPPFFFDGCPGDLGGTQATEADPDLEDRDSIALTVVLEFVGLTTSGGKPGEVIDVVAEVGEVGKVDGAEEDVVEIVLLESLLDCPLPLVL